MKKILALLFFVICFSEAGYSQTIFGINISDKEQFKYWDYIYKENVKYYYKERVDVFSLVAYDERNDQLQFRSKLPGEDDFFSAYAHLEMKLGEATFSKDSETDFAIEHYDDLSKSTLVELGDLTYNRLWELENYDIALTWNDEGLSLLCKPK